MRSTLPILTLSLLLLSGCGEAKSDAAPPGSTVNNNGSGASGAFTSVNKGSSTPLGTIDTVTADQAKEIALKQAGVLEAETQGCKVETDTSKGYTEYYVTFWVKTVEHFYAVLGADGSLISFSTVFHETGYDPSVELVPQQEDKEQDFVAAVNALSSAEVREILSKHAAISSTDIKNMIISEGFNGSIPQYLVTFSTETHDYQYAMASSTGMIFSFTKEARPEESLPVIMPEDLVAPTPETTTPVVPEPSTTPTIPDIAAPEVETAPSLDDTLSPDSQSPEEEMAPVTPDTESSLSGENTEPTA